MHGNVKNCKDMQGNARKCKEIQKTIRKYIEISRNIKKCVDGLFLHAYSLRASRTKVSTHIRNRLEHTVLEF